MNHVSEIETKIASVGIRKIDRRKKLTRRGLEKIELPTFLKTYNYREQKGVSLWSYFSTEVQTA